MADGKDVKRQLRAALQTSDIARFSSVLDSTEEPSVELVDEAGYTGSVYPVLHDLADLRLAETLAMQCFDRVVSLFQRLFPDRSKSNLQIFANRQTTEERKSALYLCTQNNKVVSLTQSLALRLLEFGADPSIPDFQGNTCLHAAAARDQVRLVYFYVKVCDVDLRARNAKGRTALHVAALEGADQTASVIIAWSQDLDEKDDWGMTALHLAAFSQCYRVVRHLLMAGAQRSLRDNKNATARDLAITRNNLELADMLKTPSCLSSLNPLRTPLQPSSNSHSHFILYHIVFLVRYAVVVLLLIPWIELPLGVAVLCCFAISFALYELVSIIDPGFVTKQENRDFSYLYKKYSPDYVCAYCETKRNRTVRHCQHCNRCVKVPFKQHFDHHCPWLHNCVGKRSLLPRNIKLFFLFLSVNLVDFALQLAIGVIGEI